MTETCDHCGALFTVSCIGATFSGACLEPINCPHCKALIREERTSGSFIETLVKAPPGGSALARHLGITDDEWDEMGVELNENTGNSGDMVYCYWFIVPDATSDDILEKTGWKIGQMVDDIPVWVVDSEPDSAA
ncbi:hypothetical protein [Aeromonas caviae]|uniref:hypothetical protein n=1 Tax=Aeromonas caviae TaxID=648 RepID=UPI002B490827|nr:hypothetical protein [Aeromonas caviae]